MPAQGSFNGQTIPYYDPFFDLANAETLSAQAASYDPALSQLDFGMIDYPADLSVAPAPDAIAVDSGINVNAALDEHNEDGLTLPSDIHAMTNVPAGHFLTADPPSIGAPAGGESSFGPIRQRQDSNAAGSVGSQKPYRPYLAQERKKVSREPPEFVPFEKRPVSRHNAPLTPSRLRQSKTRGPSSSVSPAELAKVKSGNIVVTIPTVSPATRPATNSTLAQLSSPAASSEIDPEEGPSSSPSSSPPAARPLSPKRKYGEVEEVKKGKMTGPAESARKMRKVTDIPFEDGLLLSGKSTRSRRYDRADGSVPAMFIPDYDGAPTTTEPPTHKDEPLAAARQQTPPDSPTTGALMSDLFGDGDKDIAGDVQLDNAAPKLAATSSTSAGPSGSWTASDQALLDSADPSPMPNDQELERAAATALLGLGDYALSMPASSVRGMDDEEVDYDDSPDEFAEEPSRPPLSAGSRQQGRMVRAAR